MKLIAALALALSLAACSSNTPTGDPVADCRTLESTFCARAVDCLAPGDANRDADIAACEASAQQSADCTTAKGVTSSYTACMEAVGTDSCAALTPGGQAALPPVCAHVIVR
jgi:hypothetical protein